jgi:hypothetical protein
MPAFDVDALTDKPLPVLLSALTTLCYESKIGKGLSMRASMPKGGIISQH